MKKKLVIKSSKQENGLWGMPLNCIYIDRMIYTTDENWLKHSAFCIGIAETYPNERFKIYFTTEKGFCVKLSSSGWKGLRYDDYELKDNVLMWNN